MRKVDFARCEFGKEEKEAVNRILSGTWLANGKENDLFEKEFASKMRANHAVAVNSGSSALLLSLKSLGLKKGEKVLTSACGFPATLAPIIHLGYEPILVDYDLLTHNIDISQVEKACREEDVSAMIIAHTMGSPVDMIRIMKIAKKYDVLVIEDCCEAVGSMINDRYVGTFGDIGCFSFYPSHQITALGTGGMAITDNESISREIKSMRDWGKVWDGENNLGDKKTSYEYGDLKYFKQYTYQTIGFNMKLSEASAAFGREQIKRIDINREKRIINYNYLIKELNSVVKEIVPVHSIDGAKPSWFGFPITLKMPGYRNSLSEYLENKGIRTRPFFAGNITRHAPYKHLLNDYRVADKLMNDSLFVGVWQGLGYGDLNYIADNVCEYLTNVLVA